MLASAATAGNRVTTPHAVFSYEYHPSLPRDDYTAGELGIVVPTYARAYLYVAYRWMSGAAVTPEEQREVRKRWAPDEPAPEHHQSVWNDLTYSAGLRSPDLEKYEKPNIVNRDTRGFVQFPPCRPHAFGRAAERLRQHIDRFGAESREVREWVQAQDLVFANCDLRESWTVPPTALANAHPAIRDDRRYQIAAANFIAWRFDEAERLFRQIEPDGESWAGLWAPYMVGRSILWQARTAVAASGEEYRQLLRKAQRAFEATLRNDGLSETHDAARHLLIRILSTTEPEAAARLLGIRLMSPLRAKSREQDMAQYLDLLDNHTRKSSSGRADRPHPEVAKLGVRDELTDWILAFQWRAYSYSVSRWRAKRSTAWLISCLAHAEASSAESSELLAAAAEEPDGPGWASVQFYRARLLAATGEHEQARAVLDLLLPEISTRSSSWNRALALRAQLGRTPNDMFQYGVRRPASFGVLTSYGIKSAPWEWRRWHQQTLQQFVRRGDLVMPEVADILNAAVPLKRFAQIAQESDWLPQPVRQDLIVAAWLRAVLLEERRLEWLLAGRVGEIVPEAAADMERFRSASVEDRRLFAATIALKYPGMSALVHPGTGRSSPLNEMHRQGFNWWWWTKRGQVDPSPPDAGLASWLTEQERALAEDELDRIVALGNGAAWLYSTVLESCTGRSAPPICAEALYRTVVSEDYIDYWHGLQYLPYEIELEVEAKAAKTLKSKFAGTPWARRLAYEGPTVKEPRFQRFSLSAAYKE